MFKKKDIGATSEIADVIYDRKEEREMKVAVGLCMVFVSGCGINRSMAPEKVSPAPTVLVQEVEKRTPISQMPIEADPDVETYAGPCIKLAGDAQFLNNANETCIVASQKYNIAADECTEQVRCQRKDPEENDYDGDEAIP